jgi:hypothetical protein
MTRLPHPNPIFAKKVTGNYPNFCISDWEYCLLRMRLVLLGGEKQVGLSVLLRDTWKQYGFW